MLRVRLAINANEIADYEVRNICPADRHTAGGHRCSYTVSKIIRGRYTGAVLFSLDHHRSDGAHVLASAVLTGLAEREL